MLIQLRRRPAELALALCFVALGIATAVIAWRMPFGEPSLPGPGVMPFAVGCLLTACALAIAMQALRIPATAAPVELGHRDVLTALAGLALLSWLLVPVGAPIMTALLLAVLFRVLARVKLWRAMLGGLLGSVLVWVVFVGLLGVALPPGPIIGR